MKHLLVLTALVSMNAFAHVEPGTWAGATRTGDACSFVAGRTFMDGVPNPLNERVELKVHGLDLVLRHPAVIDAATATASFDHDHFEGLVPVRGGAKAIVVKMSHEEGSDGPVSFTWIENDWKAGTKTAVECLGLRHVAE